MDRILPLSFGSHWKNPQGLIQIAMGPRQVGKTTALSQRARDFGLEHILFLSADLPTPPTSQWIVENWEKARQLQKHQLGVGPGLPSVKLILDEIQKIPRWSETVKGLWDEDTRKQQQLDVWLLGSSALLIEKGLSESLAGRFEMSCFPHWTFLECKKVFQASLQEYSFFGGYPKAYSFRDDLERGQDYIQNSILETTLGRDVLTLHSVEKPALLRQLFWYVSKLPAHIVSYEKILDHLQGKGNAATLVHYAELLQLAFILCPIYQFSTHPHRKKKSQPKWILPNPALIDPSLKKQPVLRDFIFENLIGAHLCNLTFCSKAYQLEYWKQEDQEIDFILSKNGEPVLALEVKSGKLKNIPSKKVLQSRGLNCPFVVIQPKHAEVFLSFLKLEELIEEHEVFFKELLI